MLIKLVKPYVLIFLSALFIVDLSPLYGGQTPSKYYISEEAPKIPLRFKSSSWKMLSVAAKRRISKFDPLTRRGDEEEESLVSLITTTDLQKILAQVAAETHFSYKDLPKLAKSREIHSTLHRHLTIVYLLNKCNAPEGIKYSEDFTEVCKAFLPKHSDFTSMFYKTKKGWRPKKEFMWLHQQPLWGCYTSSPEVWIDQIYSLLVSCWKPRVKGFENRIHHSLALFKEAFPEHTKFSQVLKDHTERILVLYKKKRKPLGKKISDRLRLKFKIRQDELSLERLKEEEKGSDSPSSSDKKSRSLNLSFSADKEDPGSESLVSSCEEMDGSESSDEETK